MRKAYIERLKEGNVDEDIDIDILPKAKRGRPCLLGTELENKLQMYLKKIREQGGTVSSTVVMGAARGMLQACNPAALAENGGHISLGRSWAFHLLQRMQFVKRKATTSKSKPRAEDFLAVKKTVFG